jgi:Fur family iron response transcriptional regulator
MSKTSLTARLARAGLRPTAKRLQLAHVLFDGGDKHFTAEQAHEMATKAGMRMSQATVYNTLNQLAAAGLLNRIALDSKRTFFDTNTGDHHHIFYDDDGELVDVPLDLVQVVGTPALKPGETLRRVDVILRVTRPHP